MGSIAGPAIAVGPNTDDSATAATLSTVAADTDPIETNETYHGSDGVVFSSMIETDDGGYLLVGWTDSGDRDDGDQATVVKIDAQGDREWTRRFGGEGTDRLFDVVETDDGYMAVGRSNDDSGWAQAWAVGLSENGDVRWENEYGDARGDAFWSVSRVNDTYLLGGWTPTDDSDADGYAVAVDDRGETEWEWRTDESRNQYVRDSVATDDGFVLVGDAESADGTTDGYVAKLDTDGTLLWEETHERAGENVEYRAVTAGDGEFAVAGVDQGQSNEKPDGLFARFTDSGEFVNSRTYGDRGYDMLEGIDRDGDGYILSGGNRLFASRNLDGWLIRTDEAGNAEWRERLGTADRDALWPVLSTDSGYAAAGFSGDEGWYVGLSRSVDGTVSADNGTSTVVFGDEPVTLAYDEEYNVSNVSASITQRRFLDSSMPGTPVYAASLSTNGLEKDSTTITARFDEEAIRERNASVDSLRLGYYSDGKWQFADSETTVDNGTVVVSATLPSSASVLGVSSIEGPTAAVDGVPAGAVEPGESVDLNASASTMGTAENSSVSWSFDGGSVDGESATVQFDEPGYHNVTATVTDEYGLTDERTVTVAVNDQPAVSVDAPTSMSVGESAELNANVTNEIGDTTVTWILPNGNQTGSTAEYTPQSATEQSVVVVVRDEYGAETRQTIDISVDEVQNQQDTEATTSTTTPGFGTVVAFVSLILFAVTLTRRTRR
ncbi:PKD domain-containing protein [Haloprofundus halobius]|uniref:PKD domain-containing protein n=1 Tax=Haloprofundus halobius TaxID=2876194 RepID=UPI001CCC5AEB|nr:PKD domain-containing protein [Haloprofundus halobius]